ncbi:MAG TPA: SBBP repeat-containing protein, partial [Acidobacteriota bacterium]|nr:SBBP repeat-containing protein [Acidobacteriota bacterium]
LSIGVDSFGSAYVSCVTTSPDYPTLNPFQANWAGQEDIAVTKLNSDGSALIYSTYLGGIGRDILSAISIDSAGNAFVAGVTNSTDFPLQNALQPNYGGGIYDGFITELNNVGNALVYSTYLGGSGWDDIFAITVDSTGAAYLAGDANDSPDFPTTPGAFDTVCGNGPGCGSTEGCDDATVSKIAPLGQSLVFSTFLGGDCIERAFAIDIDSAGAVYVTGNTLSDDFPLVNPIQATLEGQIDAFVTKLSPDGSELIYSTFLGGNDWDTGNAIAVDSSGAAYVAGRERSTNFPTVNALSTDCGLDGFITRVSPQGDAWDYSTCLGGSFFDEVLGITVDETGTAYIAGYTLSTDFPIRNAAQPNNAGEFDAFVTKIICDSIKGPNAVENSGLAVFTVDLCIPRSSDVTINYSTSDGSAIAGEDYVSTSEPLIIPAGETSGTIQIQILDDSISESDENFFLDITSSNVDFGLSRVEATIRDNDGLLFDDFENHVMNWQVVKGQWIETNGTLIGIATNAAIAFAPIPWSPSSASGCSNCTIEIDMETAGGSFNKVIVEGWYQDNRNRVELILNEEKDKWILKQRSGGSIVAKAKAAAVLNPQVRYDVLLSFDGSNFSLIVNGSQILTMQAAAAPSGKVGLKVKKTTGTFGQIRVY